jgi:uncharacterized membrane protein
MKDSKNKSIFLGLGLIILLNYFQFIVTNNSDEPSGPLLSILNPVLVSVFVFWHGFYRYGLKNMFLFFVLVFVVGWTFETMSIFTGFPFGWYNYTDQFGPKIGEVPFMIMPAYFAFGYLSWTIASVLTDNYQNKIEKSSLLVLPITASFIMAAWDLSGDIIWSTVGNYWTWTNGGELYGVPVTNYLGWYFVVFIFFFIFSLYMKNPKEFQPKPITKNKWYWILPAVMYFSAFIPILTSYLFKDNREIKSLDNHTWWTTDIYGAALLIGLWTLLPIVLYTIYKVNKNFKKTE